MPIKKSLVLLTGLSLFSLSIHLPLQAAPQTPVTQITAPRPAEALWWDRYRLILPPHYASSTAPTLILRPAHGKAEHYTLLPEGPLSDVDTTAHDTPYGQYLSFRVLKGPQTLQEDWLEKRIQYAPSLKTAHGTTGIQLAPVLDRYFATHQPLGVHYTTDQRPQLTVWAPTAKAVRVIVKDPQGTSPAKATQLVTVPLTALANGLWQITGPTQWNRAYYQLETEVYQPQTDRFETYRTTDPYAVSLSTNSHWSQFVNLNDTDLFPTSWSSVQPPSAPEDWVIYELHVRDFSQKDPHVPPAHRGKFTAFQQAGLGQQHLKTLAQKGLTHVHLLPVFDIATLPETGALTPEFTAPQGLSNQPEPQAAIGKVRHQDAFNWGYDPLHYGVPEGSYSTQPEGVTRLREFREMVQSLHDIGLGVIMDVVYNHTHASGDAAQSVLDKIVPGYYYRLDPKGQVQHTSCCPDTASEHAMMEHLMVQTLVRWAKAYHVSGFRFDLMGHHTRENLAAVRKALDQLTLAKDGIDGKRIYLYGEGWRFGSLNAIAPAQAMHQVNASGSGIGTFNDRMRDSLRGGNFDHATRSDQGFINGLFLQPNHSPWNTDTPATPEAQKAQLEQYTQLIRLSMAGNLQNYVLSDRTGQAWAYRGNPPAGYTQDPQENINYVSAHDNYSLWDQIAAKAPVNTPAWVRANMQRLGLSAVLLGQGVPFLHAGSEILRSKSGDGDSYDSGDWFNALDWTYQDNGWGKGLPAAWRNEKEWPFWSPLLIQPQFKPDSALIQQHLSEIQHLLQIRKTSPLFRLRTAEAIQQQVRFLNAEQPEAQRTPGLIAMYIEDLAQQDPQRNAVLVLLNANPGPVRFEHPVLQNPNWRAFTLPQGAQPYPAIAQIVPGYGLAVLEIPD